MSEASNCGVPVELIIRGICCILPGIRGKTANIRVTSIVGRYLEHYRVYCFGEGADLRMYISSADIMTRNTERRLEIACPVLDAQIRARILHMLKVQLADSRKAWKLDAHGLYLKKDPAGREPVNSQEYFMEEAIKRAQTKTAPESGFFKKAGTFLGRLSIRDLFPGRK